MSGEDKPKIIVDDDWKTRVQAEKETQRGGTSDFPADAASVPSHSAESAPKHNDLQLPPPTFESMVSMLVTQTLAALGHIPLGNEQQPVVMLDHAKFNIDLLSMLEEKTKGNLTPDEATLISKLLHELRMVFVAATKSQ